MTDTIIARRALPYGRTLSVCRVDLGSVVTFEVNVDAQVRDDVGSDVLVTLAVFDDETAAIECADAVSSEVLP